MKKYLFISQNTRSAFVWLMAVLLAGGCTNDPMVKDAGTPGRTVTVTLPPLEVAQASDIETPQNRQAATPASMGTTTGAPTSGLRIDIHTERDAYAPAAQSSPATRAAHPAFDNVWVLQFAANGNRLQSNNIGTVAAGAACTATLTVADGCTVCIVANGPASGLAPATLTAFRTMEMELATPDALTASVPYTGTLSNVNVVDHDGNAHIVAADGKPLTLWLTPCAATLTAVVDWQVSGWKVSSLELFRVPLKMRYLLDAATETNPVPATVATNYAHVARGFDDTGWAATVTTAGSVTAGTWTLADNLRIGFPIDPSHPRDHAHAPELSTFVRVRAKNDIGVKSVVFDLFPGSGATDSYDIARNHSYIARIAISGTEEDLLDYAASDDRVDESMSRLRVDQNGILTYGGKMVFVQFGSVVGFTQEGPWAADKVLFNPVAGSDYSTYTNIPRYNNNGTDWTNNLKNISESTYHNGANVKAGKGDPCRLVGLSAAQVQLMTETELDAYDSGWRLPTVQEQKTFTGHFANSGYYVPMWTSADSRFNKWYNSNTSAGGYFPKGSETQKIHYLPAPGYRNGSGSDGGSGGSGYYWMNEPAVASNGYCMGFWASELQQAIANSMSHGFGARCVRDQTVKINGLRWATGNLVADGANGCKIGTPEDNGLYFLLGSLIGWSGGPTGDGTGAGTPPAEKTIQVKPTGYTGSTTWPAEYMKGGSFPGNDNPATGLGDPCRYYLGNPWRLPTKDEWAALLGTTGENTNKQIPLKMTAYDLSFPASGQMWHGSGLLQNIGSNGFYWSRTAATWDNFHRMSFVSGSVSPENFGAVSYGQSVRCVKP